MAPTPWVGCHCGVVCPSPYLYHEASLGSPASVSPSGPSHQSQGSVFFPATAELSEVRGSHGNKEGVPGRGYSLGKSRQRGARLVCLRSCRKAPVPLPTPILFSGTIDATPLTTEPDIQARHSPSLHCRQPCPYCFLCQPSLCTRHLLQGASRDLVLPSQGCCMMLLAKLNPLHSLTARGTVH